MSEILTPKEWSAEFMCVIDATVDEDASVRACEAEDRLKAHDAALRAENAKLREALPSDEDECPCCLTHSCEAFRAYVSRARAAEWEGKG